MTVFFYQINSKTFVIFKNLRYDVPYVFLMDNAIQNNYTESDASFLFSVIGIMNMIGEVSIV